MIEIVNDGKAIMLDRTFNTEPIYSEPNRFKVGVGLTDVNVTDTDLENPVQIDIDNMKPIAEGYPVTQEQYLEVGFRFFLDADEANDNLISEIGLFDENGKMYSRVVLPEGSEINKVEGVQVAFVQKDRF